ncbi:hypothetical protein L211DRAFT_840774 [Terfezia boudieri ATCC MYA-4762]|uniref:Uncharacterized protein n=1 Tax=Terfezia boudieri ATCC MYA-4762 TaxID=1051890 RepID=A0A3N4LEM3_9PEZI|nr:hypothetical protein L211DRAFT_840774 [Terfezia boudieri ATCC MYA-4762]
MDSDSENESTCSIRSYPSISVSEASSGSAKDGGNEICDGDLFDNGKNMDVELLGDKNVSNNKDYGVRGNSHDCSLSLGSGAARGLETDVESALIISAGLVTFEIDTELGSVAAPEWLAAIKTKIARFGRQYLTRSELDALRTHSLSAEGAETLSHPLSPGPPTSVLDPSATPEQSSSQSEQRSRRIVQLLAEKETKNVYYQARLLSALFVPSLGWKPLDMCDDGRYDPNLATLERTIGAGAVYIQLNFQPLGGDVVFRWATVELEFTGDSSALSSASTNHEANQANETCGPRILLFSPIHIKESSTHRTRTLSRGLQVTAGAGATFAAAGAPGVGVNSKGTFDIRTQREVKEIGQRMIHGTLRGEKANRVVWTIGGDKVTGEGVLSIYRLATILELRGLGQASTSKSLVDIKANLKIEAITNVRRHKVVVKAKNVPIHFRVAQPLEVEERTPSMASGLTGKVSIEVAIEGTHHSLQSGTKGGLQDELLLAVLGAPTEEEAQEKLDAMTATS